MADTQLRAGQPLRPERVRPWTVALRLAGGEVQLPPRDVAPCADLARGPDLLGAMRSASCASSGTASSNEHALASKYGA